MLLSISRFFEKGEISRSQSNHAKGIQEKRPKLSLEELVCGGLTLKTGEKYDQITRIKINKMFRGSSIIPLTE